MDKRIPTLPNWVINDIFPAVYDTESATAIEQTAKLYMTVKNMVDDYNKFANEVNKTIEEFITGVNSNQECFEKKITKTIHDYIDYMNSKIASQDKVINDTIVYIKDNLKPAIQEVIEQMKESGEFDEALTNAFNNIGNRVATLEIANTELKTKVETLEEDNTDLKTRLLTLENKETYLKYTEETKELDLIINELEGETI